MSPLTFKSWLVLGLIFVMGIVTGVALTVGTSGHWMHPPGGKQMQRHWLGHLTEELKLNNEQQAKIRPLLEDASNQINRVHQDEVGRISAIFQGTDAKIAPLLTADQQPAFARMKEERQRDFSHHFRRGKEGAPDGPPQGGPKPSGP